MLEWLKNIYESYNWVVDVSGWGISVGTLFAALRLRSHLYKSFEKKDFKENSDAICSEIEGYKKSLDDFITDSFLMRIDDDLDLLFKKYTFFPCRIKYHHRKISYLIRKRYLKSKRDSRKRAYITSIKRSLNSILTGINKEGNI